MALFKSLGCYALLAVGSYALPSSSLDTPLARRQGSDLPVLNLDYGSYRAASYNSDADIYTFKNIRYAAPPTGTLRWRKPQPPTSFAGVADGSVGFACMQPNSPPSPQSEDCLFLDLYVPGKAVRNPSAFSLPVVAWTHGGNNRNGAKDQRQPIYFNGTGPIMTSNNNLIFVSFNYRLGAFGFLAGDTMEKQGLPNAGLHDQRAVYKWIQKYINLVGGDKTKVSAWGESSGASNILHLLTAQGGTLDPLFLRAFLQSPASQTFVDRLGMLEDCFQTFATYANCGGLGVDCLRGQSSATLQSAANQLFASGKVCGGTASDGVFVRQALSLEFANRAYWKQLDSVIVTHVSNESVVFVPANITTDAAFRKYVASLEPSYANGSIVDAVTTFYPSPTTNNTYSSQYERVSAFIRDASITVRVAAGLLAYYPKVWAGEYSVPPGYHATDLIPLFWNKYLTLTTIPGPQGFVYPVPPNINALSATYQSYAVSQATTGDPNTNANFNANSYPAIQWPKPGSYNNQRLTNVLNFTSDGLSLVTDDQVLADNLVFQAQLTASVTNTGGYAVPGTSVDAGPRFPPKPADPSKNYNAQCTECQES